MGRHLDFQVWADVLDFGVEVLHQQHEPQVSVLQLVLVARVTANPAGVPALTGEIDNGARLVEQAQDVRAQQALVELANGIDATAEQANGRQIDKAGLADVQEQAAMRGLKAGLVINAEEVFNGVHLISCY